ncbi:hypothetical protein [Chryseobacterium limigenitum]|uniref:Uncharacterized protein n=1 Tax=Chryseobacterium limigenitum TaxID=1612149 RepID=A0A1K2ISG6_9FLAO|nr:hypothetical protein [Chryseobacterium limigenitum]SFZ95254.1 hypothetical protein SAMN05216324_10922 [Chryseobacterium limigenitum]
MEILPLQFVSPKVLNELGQARVLDRETWFYDETDEELELDTEKWFISSGSEQAKIDRWEVNQTSHRMRLKTGSASDGFESLDYPFAVSMIGQIGNKQNLQDYLASLQEIYLVEFREETHIAIINTTKKDQEDE